MSDGGQNWGRGTGVDMCSARSGCAPTGMAGWGVLPLPHLRGASEA